MAEPPGQGVDVETELGFGQGEPPLLLGPERGPESRAVGIAAPADLDAEAEDAVEGDDGAPVLEGGPERPFAAGSAAGRGGQLQLAGRLRPGSPSGLRSNPRRVVSPSLKPCPIANQGSGANLEKKGSYGRKHEGLDHRIRRLAPTRISPTRHLTSIGARDDWPGLRLEVARAGRVGPGISWRVRRRALCGHPRRSPSRIQGRRVGRGQMSRGHSHGGASSSPTGGPGRESVAEVQAGEGRTGPESLAAAGTPGARFLSARPDHVGAILPRATDPSPPPHGGESERAGRRRRLGSLGATHSDAREPGASIAARPASAESSTATPRVAQGRDRPTRRPLRGRRILPLEMSRLRRGLGRMVVEISPGRAPTNRK
jgi:hypothetical protein